MNGPLITMPGLDRPWRVAHLQLSRARVTHHHGSDEEAGPRGVVIEGAQDIARLGRHARFLAQVPQRRFPGGFARLPASAGQRPLSGVIPQAGGSPGDQKAGHVLPQKDAHRHRRGPQAGSRYLDPREGGQVIDGRSASTLRGSNWIGGVA